MLHEGFELIAVAGIGLEIIGFILMIRLFNKTPTKQNLDHFNKKNRKRIEANHPHYLPKRSMFLREIPGDIHSGINKSVSEAFFQDWFFKTKTIPLFSVVFGLFLQGLQLFLN